MANQVTKTMSKVFATILLGILIVSFAIFGTGPGILSSNTTNVAIVGDIKISPQRLSTRVQNRAADLQQQTNLDMDTTTLITTFGLDYQVLQEMISEATVTAEASSMGLAASDDQVAEVLSGIDAFKVPGGGFDQNYMRQTLQASGLSVADFIESIEESIISSHLVSAMAAAAPYPYFATETLYALEEEKRQASLMNFPISDIEDIAAPDNETLAAFYEPKKEDFKSPARRSYNYILIKPEIFFDQVEVTREDKEAVYADRFDEFVDLEERDILQVTVPDETAAVAIRAAIAGGKTFTEAATELTAFGADELSIGKFTERDLASTYGDDTAYAVFTAEEQTVVGPLTTDLGFQALFFVTQIESGSEKTFDDVSERLEFLARTEKATDMMYDLLPNVEDAVLADGSLELVAERLELAHAKVPLVDRDGVNLAGERILSQSDETRILSIAFQAQIGEEPTPTNIDPTNEDKGVFFLEVSEIQEPAIQELMDVRSRVLDLWQLEAKQAKAGEIAEQGRGLLEAGLSPESVVNDLGGTAFEANNVARTQSDSLAGRISPNIRRLIFDLEPGEIGIEQSSDGYVVVRLNEVKQGDPLAAPGEVLLRQDQLKDSFSNDLLLQYQQYLVSKYPPEINQQLLDQLFRNPIQQQLP